MRAAPECRNHSAGLIADSNVIDSGSSPQGDFPRLCREYFSRIGRRKELDAATGSDGREVAVVAGEREGGIGQSENYSAMASVMSIDHIGANCHLHGRTAGAYRDNDHAQCARRLVSRQHRVSDFLRQ